MNKHSVYFLTKTPHTSYPSMMYKPIITKEIENVIKSLYPKNSHGYELGKDSQNKFYNFTFIIFM